MSARSMLPTPAVMSVATKPGQSEMARMPCSQQSLRTEVDRPQQSLRTEVYRPKKAGSIIVRYDNLLQRSAQNFKSQRDVLMKISKKVEERSLQIYFW